MNHIQTNSWQAWVLAARPKTLAGAATPVFIGTSLALAQGPIQVIPVILCFLFAFAMQIDANLINDYFDFIKGSDREDRLGPERACAQGWITTSCMKKGIILTTLLSAALGLCILYYSGAIMIPVGMLCILFAFLYTAGPYPMAYHGWGDVLVLVFFGFVPVGCTYYTLCHDWSLEVSIASLACGLVIDQLLMVNNFRDYYQDKESGKKTVVVRWGLSFGKWAYLLLGVMACCVCVPLAASGMLGAALLPQLFLIPHFGTWKKMVTIGKGRELNRVLGETARNITIFGLLLSIGILSGLLFY